MEGHSPKNDLFAPIETIHNTENLDYDVVVVGSGPAGATVARFTAAAGWRTLLVDKRQELGAPVQCSGAVSRGALEETGVPIHEEFIHEAIYGFAVYNEAGEKTTIDYRHIDGEKYGTETGKVPLGYVVDRRRFDRYLMTQAERAGAEVRLKTEALGYQPLDDGTCTITLRHYNTEQRIRTRIVVGADGLQSQVGKWAGLKTHIRLSELASCLQFVVDRVETEGLLEIVTGHEWAPGGYAWVFPKGYGYAEVGLGVIRTVTETNARQQLDHFIKNSFFKRRFAHARILEVQGGGVPLAAPLKKQFAQNMILVGDAARHVNPITGGGIHTALSGGMIAGKFLNRLFENNLAATEAQTERYQQLWLDKLGNKMWKLYHHKTEIFREPDVATRDQRLYETMSDYFRPDSEYKKI